MFFDLLCIVWQLIGIVIGILLLIGFAKAIVEYIGGRKNE